MGLPCAQEIAEWSPQDYVVASNYPASRLAGGVGAAGSSIRDPTVRASNIRKEGGKPCLACWVSSANVGYWVVSLTC